MKSNIAPLLNKTDLKLKKGKQLSEYFYSTQKGIFVLPKLNLAYYLKTEW